MVSRLITFIQSKYNIQDEREWRDISTLVDTPSLIMGDNAIVFGHTCSQESETVFALKDSNRTWIDFSETIELGFDFASGFEFLNFDDESEEGSLTVDCVYDHEIGLVSPGSDSFRLVFKATFNGIERPNFGRRLLVYNYDQTDQELQYRNFHEEIKR